MNIDIVNAIVMQIKSLRKKTKKHNTHENFFGSGD